MTQVPDASQKTFSLESEGGIAKMLEDNFINKWTIGQLRRMHPIHTARQCCDAEYEDLCAATKRSVGLSRRQCQQCPLIFGSRQDIRLEAPHMHMTKALV